MFLQEWATCHGRWPDIVNRWCGRRCSAPRFCQAQPGTVHSGTRSQEQKGHCRQSREWCKCLWAVYWLRRKWYVLTISNVGHFTYFICIADTRTDQPLLLGHALLQHQHIGVLPSSSEPLDVLPLLNASTSTSMPESWVRWIIFSVPHYRLLTS